ncbi:MAG: esterase-like activity of phytase family protein [Candidatus Binatia bacterium]
MILKGQTACVFFLFFLLTHPFFYIGNTQLSAESLSVTASTIALDPGNPSREIFGGLIFLSGYELTSNDSRFGGLSGLELSADGNLLYAVSDHGYWLSARLHHDPQGRLTGLGPWEIAPLLTPDGSNVSWRQRDAEALVRDRDGSFIVAFERAHRLWRYPPPAGALTPFPLPSPADLQRAPINGGLEAVTLLSDRRLLALTEKYENQDGSLKGWLIDKDRFFPLSYLPSDGFRPTDLATLANGDVLLLERWYHWIGGVAVRLRRLQRDSIRAGARLRGEEIVHLDPSGEIDNFEGLAVRVDPAGGTLLYMISDDNYSQLQRTLLLQFHLPATSH